MPPGRPPPAAPPPPSRLYRYDNAKTGKLPYPMHQAKQRILLGLAVGALVGGMLGSIGSAALWTLRASRNNVPSFLTRPLHGKSGRCQETLREITQKWERACFEEAQELDRACDGKIQQLKTDAQEALARLEEGTAALNNASHAPAPDVLACERVLDEMLSTPPLAPHDIVSSDTGIESLGILTEGAKAADVFLQEGRAPLHATPKGLFLANGPSYGGPPLRAGAGLTVMELADCAETDVLLLEPDRCYALVGSESSLPAGGIAEFEWEEAADKWHRRPQRKTALASPALPAMEAHEGMLWRLFDALPEIEALLEPLVADAVPEGPLDWELLPDLPDRTPTGAGLAVVLVVGKGQHQELMNQACAKIEMMGTNMHGRILVLAEDEATAGLARALEYKRVMTHSVFSNEGTDKTAEGQEVHTAWLRLLAAWLMVRRGADVLIHGPEFVWVRHWSQALTDGRVLDSWRHDLAFMADDDAARHDEPGAPFHPHPQGLWHVHANLRSLHFFQQLLFQQDYVVSQGDAGLSAARSAMAQVMEDLEQRISLHLLRLSPLDFAPSTSPRLQPDAFGAILNRNREESARHQPEDKSLWRVLNRDCSTTAQATQVLQARGPEACCWPEQGGRSV